MATWRSKKTDQLTEILIMKKFTYLLTFLGIILFLSCEKEDEIQTDTISTSIYNKDITNYLNLLKTESNKENSLKIEALVNAIDLNSVKIYTLKTTEKLLVADLKSLKGFEISDKTKAIFFVYENEITHSNIVTFNVKVPFDNLDKVILSVLDMKKNKDNYTGKISFYNMHQNISLSNEFENGKLTFNGMARRKTTRNITGKSAGCIDWYWVTGSSYIYLYTTCDCYAYRMSGIKCGGGGGGGGLSSSSSGPAYPSNPPDKTLFTYIDEDGQIITKRYNEEALTWEFFSISLSEVVINNNPTKYSYLIIQWPIDQQKVVTKDFIYTYDGASGGWNGVPATELNPCDQIKNVMNYNPNDSNSFKSNLNWLKDKVNATVNDKECGVEVRKIMNYDESYRYEFTQVLSNDQFSVSLSTNRDNVGASHSHPSNGYAMFSFQDVRFLLAVYDGAFDNRKGEVFNSVVCRDNAGNTNTYMLKIDNIDVLRTQINAVWNEPNYAEYSTEKTRIDAIHLDQAKLYAKSNGQLEKSFLQQFAAFGISIYKGDATLSSFDKLALSNSTVTSTPCN